MADPENNNTLIFGAQATLFDCKLSHIKGVSHNLDPQTSYGSPPTDKPGCIRY